MEPIPDSQSAEMEPQDREVIEQLAKLQDMYNQILKLRTLLPDKLVNPARQALEHPGRYAPEKLAAFLNDAAVSGSKDIKTFKRDYHSDAMRDLWLKANTSDIPQGRDGWSEDYLALVKGFHGGDKADVRPIKTENHLPGDERSEIEVLKQFRDANPECKVEVIDETKGFPLDMAVSQMNFRVDKSLSACYTVTMRPDEPSSPLSRSILLHIAQDHNEEGLASLLNLLASYQGIKTQPCDKCEKVFDKELQFAILRKQKEPKDANKDITWSKYHSNCI